MTKLEWTNDEALRGRGFDLRTSSLICHSLFRPMSDGTLLEQSATARRVWDTLATSHSHWPSASPLAEGERIKVRGFQENHKQRRTNPHPPLSLTKGEANTFSRPRCS